MDPTSGYEKRPMHGTFLPHEQRLPKHNTDKKKVSYYPPHQVIYSTQEGSLFCNK